MWNCRCFYDLWLCPFDAAQPLRWFLSAYLMFLFTHRDLSLGLSRLGPMPMSIPKIPLRCVLSAFFMARIGHSHASGHAVCLIKYLQGSLYTAPSLSPSPSLSLFLSRSAFAYFDVYKYTAICFCCSDATLMDKGAASVRQPVCVWEHVSPTVCRCILHFDCFICCFRLTVTTREGVASVFWLDSCCFSPSLPSSLSPSPSSLLSFVFYCN